MARLTFVLARMLATATHSQQRGQGVYGRGSRDRNWCVYFGSDYATLYVWPTRTKVRKHHSRPNLLLADPEFGQKLQAALASIGVELSADWLS